MEGPMQQKYEVKCGETREDCKNLSMRHITLKVLNPSESGHGKKVQKKENQ